MIVEAMATLRAGAICTTDEAMNRRWLIAGALIVLLAVPIGAAEKLNLNTATTQQLVALGLSESQAMQIIAHREKSGPLLQVEELLAVQQMKKDTFEKIRERVTVDE
jgi:competence ComEA-like helix-hairpin-helix protein